ncbi:hypothetical protein [Bartonella phoceensis]|uniref:hypothetical protein n=1 Tax=Bartonella phoceensis TaxID=270249 RepID=UPI001ABA4D38|nr:hypothetical protein [Bartonella phoceensis]
MVILIGMAIIGLCYFVIKRTRLYFNLLEELKKNAAHPSDDHQRKIMEQNAAYDPAVPAVPFKKSLFLWPRELKIICFLSLIIVLLQSVFFTANLAGWKSETSFVIIMLFSVLWFCFFLFAPFMGLFYIKLRSKLKKTIQQLEEATAQKEKTIFMQNARGEKNDQ